MVDIDIDGNGAGDEKARDEQRDQYFSFHGLTIPGPDKTATINFAIHGRAGCQPASILYAENSEITPNAIRHAPAKATRYLWNF